MVGIKHVIKGLVWLLGKTVYTDKFDLSWFGQNSCTKVKDITNWDCNTNMSYELIWLNIYL